jgi:SOS-response transcriptional repressor LexA
MASGLLRIPVLGAANAGPASIYAEGTVTGYLRLSDALLPKSIARSTLYALRVVGRSMNLAKIGAGKLPAEDGDYIIADGSTYEPKSNDYVVSLIDGKANIKKLILDVRNEQIALVSESTDDFPPIIISHDDNVEYLAQSKIVHVVKPPKAA